MESIRRPLTIAVVLLLSGCLNARAPGPLPPDDVELPRAEWITTFNQTFAGDSQILLPIYAPQVTGWSGQRVHALGLGSRYFAEYIAAGGDAPVLAQGDILQSVAKYSDSKYFNGLTDSFREECLDGSARQTQADAPCPEFHERGNVTGSRSRMLMREPIPRGLGYLLFTVEEDEYFTLELNFEAPVLAAPSILLPAGMTNRGIEHFDAEFMDLERCGVDSTFWCGAMLDGRFALPESSSDALYVAFRVFLMPGSFGRFCIQSASGDDCGVPQPIAGGFLTIWRRLLSPGESHALTGTFVGLDRDVEEFTTPVGVWLYLDYMPLQLPAGHPLKGHASSG